MLKLGKLPATYDARDIRYSDVRANLPLPLTNIPTVWGHGADFTSGVSQPQGWGMMGNGPQDDHTISPGWAAAGGCGDCTWAGPAHEEMQAAHEAKRPIPSFTSRNIVDQYASHTGYNPQTGANDNGDYVRSVLNWRQKNGLVDTTGKAYKIGTYVALEPGDWQSLREACYLFESVGIGLEFPDSAFDQLNAGKPWSVVPGAQVLGGHYVPIMGHPTPGLWTVITWGKRQTATWNFLAKYVDESWAYIDFERYNAVTGQTAEHYTDVDLERFITQFPAPK